MKKTVKKTARKSRNILARAGRSVVRGTKKVGFAIVGTASGVCTMVHALGAAVVEQGRAVVRGQTSFA